MDPDDRTRSEPVVPGAAADGADDLFALVTGLSVGLVVAPLAIAVVSPRLGSAGAQYLAVLVGMTAVTVTVALATRQRSGLPERLGSSNVRWLLVCVPVALAVAALALAAAWPTATVGDVAPYAVLAGFGGSIGGAVLAMMARTRYARTAVEASETVARWRAGWPASTRRRSVALGAGLVIVGVGAFLVELVWHLPVRFAGHLLVPFGIVVSTFGQPRRFRATRAGLERRFPANRQFYTWDRFAGFAVDESTITLRFEAPWRLPIYCDRSALEDPEAVVDALDSFLQRL